MPDCAICIVRDGIGRVLVVRRPTPPYEFAIPGGHIEPEESPQAAVIREVNEETGIRIRECWCCGDITAPDGTKVHVFSCTNPDSAKATMDVCWDGVAAPIENLDVAWMLPEEIVAQASTFKKSLQEMATKGWLLLKDAPVAAMDLSVSDVHVPGSLSTYAAGYRQTTDTTEMGDISAKKRRALPDSGFALPEQRKYPLPDASHVRNAAARLEQMKKAGKIGDKDYASARKRIAAAAKRAGVDSEYNKKTKRAPMAAGRLHVQIDHPHHGHFEIRHMDDKSAMLSQRVALNANDAAGDEPKWVQIATRGHFEGHSAGPFDLDDKTFSEIIRNYRDVDGGEVAFDYEHASEQDATSGSIPHGGAPAQGWIKDLKIGANGLYALVEWLEPLKSQIREGKYKYVSPAIRFNARHPKTGQPIGARLTSVAATNQPFLRGLQQLAASDKTGQSGTNAPTPANGGGVHDQLIGSAAMTGQGKAYAYGAHEFMPKIRACLSHDGNDEASTPGQCLERLKALRELNLLGGGADVDGVPVGEHIRRLRTAMNVPMTSTVDELLDAVEEMIGAAIAQHEARMHPEGAQQATLEDEDEGGGEETGTEMAATATTEMTTMADKTPPETDTVTLKDVTAKLSEQEGKVASLTLKLAERDSVITAKDAEIAVIKGENATLKDSLAKRDEADVVARVDVAFDYYAARHNLTNDQKPMLLTFAKHDRAGFEKMYPTPVDAAGRRVPPYMLNDKIVPGSKTPPVTTEAGANVALVTKSMKLEDVIKTLMAADKKLPYAEAQNKAVLMRANGELG